ncbi:[FeFe] hydrogenase H-cluster radical SAM maturase HydE [Pseudoflavonifractor sp. HCP28S3_F10]|uniref:[FeFe] hydrogenase H-cluster radical SAM maturase HydE n=1 Tax=Pseudoflavonifractor sp. HCP28S3_F10 TaxID=3438947 RepID=UPI003F886677
MRTLLDKLEREGTLTGAEFAALIRGRDEALARELFRRADVRRREYYGADVYIRGLIEFTNYCKNDCLYCGIRRSNRNARRYRLSREEILACCREGYALGYRTFVLQGGEDPWYTPERVEELVRAVKAAHPDCALTLSVGEQPRKVYQAWFDAGADRYLLRHETANDDHYRSLHPAEMSPENRKRCLWDLKDIGYQVGCGFMVGSPGQTPEHLAEDLLFLRALEPDMVGIGPFIPQHDTPLRYQPAGTLELTLFLLGLIRLMLPDVLLPATTALGTIHPRGRELGIQAGANVCMPNLSPAEVREKYALYDNKICTGDEAAQCRRCLEARMASIGYRVVVHRGDHIGKNKKISEGEAPR